MNIQTQDDLRAYVAAKVMEVLEREFEMDETTDLTAEGINSLTTIELIVLLEDEFAIQIRDEDLLVHNFQTLEAICKLLTDKYGVAVS